MDLVPITPEYYEFVRILRTHPDTRNGFLVDTDITEEEQEKYMTKYKLCYHICLLYNVPVGYIGVIEDDIRVCTVPSHQGKGVAKFMLDKIKYMYPEAIGKIKKDNLASQKLFDKCKVPYTII